MLGSQRGRMAGVTVEHCRLDAFTAREAEQPGVGRSAGGSGWAEPLLPHPVGVPPQPGLRQLKVHRRFSLA